MSANQDKAFSSEQVEAALCVWEHVIQNREPEPFASLFEGFGAGVMRLAALDAGCLAISVQAHMQSQGYDHNTAFDWDFIPAVSDILDWNAQVVSTAYGIDLYLPDSAALFSTMLAQHPGCFAPTRLSDDVAPNI